MPLNLKRYKFPSRIAKFNNFRENSITNISFPSQSVHLWSCDFINLLDLSHILKVGTSGLDYCKCETFIVFWVVLSVFFFLRQFTKVYI